MKKVALLLGWLLVVLPVAAQWKVNPAASSVAFRIKNAGIWVEGKFTDFNVGIVFDPALPAEGRISGTIQVKSVNTGINARDNHLRKAEYLDADHYPTLSFVSTGIAKTATGYVAKGNLTIKDVTKAVELPFTVQESGAEATFKANLQIDRRHFHVGGNSWVMGDVVDITLTIKATHNANTVSN